MHTFAMIRLHSFVFGMFCAVMVANAADHPVLAGFDRFPSDANGGRLLIGDMNCLSCHKADEAVSATLLPKQAPLLGEVGSRVRPEWLRSFIANPQAVKPGTTMPNLFSGLSPQETQEKVEALTHFLASLTGIANQPHQTGAAGDGETLYQRIGCVACHEPRDGKTAMDKGFVPLGDLKAKYTPASLADFLLDPLKTRPSGRMPNMKLTPKEAADVAIALIGQTPRAPDAPTNLKPGLAYSYYEGIWNKLPDFAALKPIDSGVTDDFNLSRKKREANYALKFTGFIEIAKEGNYSFYSASDDGSRLFIGTNIVVDHDGEHGADERSGSIALKPGKHQITLVFFQREGPSELHVSHQGPGIEKRNIPASVLSHTDREYVARKDDSDPDKPAFKPDPALVEKGRVLFASVGCASCHQLGGKQPSIASTLTAKKFNELRQGGCLSEQSIKAVPHFSFSKSQITAIQTALVGSARQVSLTPAQRVALTMTALNCYACHSRDGQGGPLSGAEKSFIALKDDLGDEGRIPPPLGEVGAKLKRETINAVLTQGAAVRPYMATRMPQFGPANVGQLAELFDVADTKPHPEPTVRLAAKEAVKIGRQLVGTGGLGCVQCHTFADNAALGIQVMDLTVMTQRLKRSWFDRYLPDPAALRAGTRMPTFWPDGKSTKQNVLGGDKEKQLEALWTYLAQGRNARVPDGLAKGPIELVAEDEAVIYRNFITGSSPRGIGVGYPEKANLLFDAGEMRLATIWQGGFIDASKHWVDRGSGFQGPLGENIVQLVDGAPFAILEQADATWPTEKGKAAGYKFRGYQLDKKRRPAFFYNFKTVEIEDYPVAVEGKDTTYFTRAFNFKSSAPVANLWFRSARGGKIDVQPDGTFVVDGALKLRFKLAGTDKPVVRQSGDKSELLVPVKFTGGKSKIVEEIVW